MKKILTIFIFTFFSLYSIFGQSDSEDISNDDINSSKTEKEYKEDAKLLLSIIDNIMEYNSDYSDTEVQADYKARKRKEKLVEINKKWQGHILSLNRVKLIDVKANRELSPTGKKQADLVIQTLKKDPNYVNIFGKDSLENNSLLAMTVELQLIFCESCWQKTGSYTAEYEIPIPKEEYYSGIIVSNDEYGNIKTLRVKIQKYFPNEESVLNLKKDSITPITGKIKLISWYSAGYDLIIELE